MDPIPIRDGNSNGNNYSGSGKMDIMESGDGVHTVAAMTMENSILLVSFAFAV